MGVARWQEFCPEGGQVTSLGDNSWRMEVLPAGNKSYHCAQVDDYRALRRRQFASQAPAGLALRARVSDHDLPGTWGFGFWNDPFSFSLGVVERRLPALPNAAWFFYASPPNYLALHDDHPADGFLAGTFSAPCVPPLLLAGGLPLLPLLFFPPTAARLRPLLGMLIREDAVRIEVDVTAWHDYILEWGVGRVRFTVDGVIALETPIAPRGRLGLVMWIDNQYAAFTPDGKLKFDALEVDTPMWLQVENVSLGKQ